MITAAELTKDQRIIELFSIDQYLCGLIDEKRTSESNIPTGIKIRAFYLARENSLIETGPTALRDANTL